MWKGVSTCSNVYLSEAVHTADEGKAGTLKYNQTKGLAIEIRPSVMAGCVHVI